MIAPLQTNYTNHHTDGEPTIGGSSGRRVDAVRGFVHHTPTTQLRASAQQVPDTQNPTGAEFIITTPGQNT